MSRTLRSRKGFTLIELMIVVVIIGILAALAIPRFQGSADRAREKEADGILKQINTLQEVVRARDGGYTADVGTLAGVGYTAPDAAQLKHYEEPVLNANNACASMVKKGSGNHQTRHVVYATQVIADGGCPGS